MPLVLYLNVGIDLSDDMQISFGLGISKLEFNINNEHERTNFELNVVAICLIYLIQKLRRKVQIEKDREVEMQLG